MEPLTKEEAVAYLTGESPEASRRRLTRRDLEAVSRMLARDHGITLECRGFTAHCDPDAKCITIPSVPTGGLSAETVIVTRAYLDHEVGHMVAESDTEMLEAFIEEMARKYGASFETARGCLNSVDDVRIEAIMGRLWAGAAINLRDGVRIILTFVLPRVATRPLAYQVCLLLYAHSRGLRSMAATYVAPEARTVAETFHADILAIATTPPDTTEGCLDLAERICAAVTTPQEEQEETAEPEETPRTQDTEDRGSVAFDPGALMGEHATAEIEAGGSESVASSNSHQPNSARLPADNEVDRIVPSDVHITNEIERLHGIEQAAEAMRMGAGALTRIGLLFGGEGLVAWRGGQRRGLPDPARLAQGALGLTSRICRRRRVSQAAPAACALVLDCSSSMAREPRSAPRPGQTRAREAKQAAYLFAVALERAGHAAAIFGMMDRTRHLLFYEEGRYRKSGAEMSIIKGWADRMATVRDRLFNTPAEGVFTPLAEATYAIGREVLARPERRKVLLIYTDGDVAPGPCRHVAAALETCGVEVAYIGIGIDVSELHWRTCQVDDLSDLGNETLRQLRSAMHLQEGPHHDGY